MTATSNIAKYGIASITQNQEYDLLVPTSTSSTTYFEINGTNLRDSFITISDFSKYSGWQCKRHNSNTAESSADVLKSNTSEELPVIVAETDSRYTITDRQVLQYIV